MAFVVDSSIALAWLLPDEGGSAADALADRLETQRAVAPSIWLLEVGNALLTARRRERITDDVVDQLLDVLAVLPVEIDVEPATRTLPAVVALARRHRLTTYDAAYLELAQRRALPLATLDVRLAEACRTAGVAVLP
jgi:predicted nucleic acid-binding protein